MIMRKELKRYSSIGNRAGILLLCKKVLTGHWEDLSSIGASCSFINGVDLNFKCGIIAFEEIKLISIADNKCQAKDILYSDEDENLFIAKLCHFCMNALIDMDLINTECLKYNEVKNAFQIPMYAFSMECSVYRNLLITFGALIPDGALFTINEHFEPNFSKRISGKRKISQEQLLMQLEEERIIGEKGEEFVISYEKKRCPFTLQQQSKIKQISVIDASAGFDIISLNDEVSSIKRYIEVKTYSGNVHFYWSSNEIEAARLRADKYYLYLVDYNQIEKVDYTPIIIPNPYFNVRNLSVWDIHPSSFLISTGCSSNELKEIIKPVHHQGIPYTFDYDEPYMMVADSAFETFKWADASHEIMRVFGDKGTILIGGYKSKKQLTWILETGIYNIRLGRRAGSVFGQEKCIEEAENLILYDIYNPEKFQVYNINSHCKKMKADMIALKYPNKHPGSIYMTFSITRNAALETYMERNIISNLLASLKSHKNGKPLFIEP